MNALRSNVHTRGRICSRKKVFDRFIKKKSGLKKNEKKIADMVADMKQPTQLPIQNVIARAVADNKFSNALT